MHIDAQNAETIVGIKTQADSYLSSTNMEQVLKQVLGVFPPVLSRTVVMKDVS